MGKIIVSGASGQFGNAAARMLLDRVPAEDLVLLSRTPDRLAAFAEAGAHVRHADFDDPATLRPAMDGGELPLDQAMRIQRGLARIDIAPFRYLQGKVYPVGDGPETGFIPGTYQVVTGSPDIPIATSADLLASAARNLERRDLALARGGLAVGRIEPRLRLARLLRQRLLQVFDVALQAARAPLHGFLGGADLESADVLGLRGGGQGDKSDQADDALHRASVHEAHGECAACLGPGGHAPVAKTIGRQHGKGRIGHRRGARYRARGREAFPRR